MIAFAWVNKDGIPTGGGMRRDLPEGAVPLTAPFTTLDLPRLQLVDGIWVERAVPRAAAPTGAEIAAQATALLVRERGAVRDMINAAAVRAHARVITPGMDAVYAAKRAEAESFLAQPREPDLDAYPFLKAEVGLTAATARDLARLWRDKAEQTTALQAAIEAERRRALLAIAAAPDIAALDLIQPSFTEALSRLAWG